MSLYKQMEYIGLLMHRVLNNEAPEYVSDLCTRPPSRYSNCRNCQFHLPRPRIYIFKRYISFPGAFLCNKLPLTIRSYSHSLSSFKRKLLVHTEAFTEEGLCQESASGRGRQTERKRWQRRSGFRVIGIAVAVIGHLRPSFYISSVPPGPPDADCF